MYNWNNIVSTSYSGYDSGTQTTYLIDALNTMTNVASFNETGIMMILEANPVAITHKDKNRI